MMERQMTGTGREALLFAALVAGLLGLACEDPPKPAAPTPPPAAAPKPAPKPAATAPKPAEPVKVVEEKTLSDEDFVESIENSRDPFRSYLKEFSAPMKRTVKVQRKILMARYGLSELALIAVVTGPVRARAMFKDPTGLGVAVKRGDYISKNEGRVKQILPDKVIVELKEQSEDQQKVGDRVIELHPPDEERKR
jgi:Tfp pilus assembly protein PilP